MKDGEWKRYFTDGKLKLKATYIDDKLEGLMLVYHQKGFPEVSGMYKNNFKDGLWLYYDEEGIVIKKERYAKGNLKEVITPDPQ
jgi:antitoxin component YwqK of YwqJK toxin-antitoxin module